MILVTGGTGLVGSHLLYHLLSLGYHVRAIKRPGSNIDTVTQVFSYYSPTAKELVASIDWVEADVLDVFSLMDAMDGITEVFHCAAIISFVPAEAKMMLKTNIEGTANVMNAAIEKKVKKICHVSSIATLGFSQQKETDEGAFWKSSPRNSMYSISKYGGEREAWRAMEEGLDVIIVNPSVIIGPGNWHKGSSNMIEQAYKKLKYYPDGVAGFIDARDVVRAMVMLMFSSIKNERFILNSENYAYKAFFDHAHDHFGYPRPFIKVGRFLAGMAWRFEKIRSLFSGKPPLLTREIARTISQKHYFSNHKIKAATGIEFISVEQSIKDSCKIYLKDRKGMHASVSSVPELMKCE